MARAGTIGGVFLRPTVSANRRIYNAANIGKAVSRMQNALQSPAGLPLTMATSHGAAYDDNALSTVGRITRVSQMPTGEATFEAELADTTAGRDIAALADPSNPFIKGVSIRGMWLGDVKTIKAPDGEDAETADDLEISGIDFTGRPGVEGAQITYALAESAHLDNSYVIHESLDEVRVEFTEESTDEETVTEKDYKQADRDKMAASGAAMANGSYPIANGTDLHNAIRAVGRGKGSHDAIRAHIIKRAKALGMTAALPDNWTSSGSQKESLFADPGYGTDRAKRFEIDTPEAIRAVWGAVQEESVTSRYTAKQVARMKGRIKNAAKKHGFDVQAEMESLTANLADVVEEQGIDTDASETVAQKMAQETWTKLHPSDEAVNKKDNDMEALSDQGAEDMEPCDYCGNDVDSSMMFCPTCGQPVPQAESSAANNDVEEADVADTETETVSESQFTAEDVAAAYAAGVAAKSGNAGPKNAMGKKASAKSPGATGTGDAEDESEDESEDENETESTQEGGQMTEAKVPETFTSEALKAIVAEAVKSATEATVAAMTAAAATTETATEEAAEPRTLTEAEIEAIREEAREGARKEAVAEYRKNGAALRKGLVENDADAAAAESWDPGELAKLPREEFQRRAAEAFSGPGVTAWSPRAPRVTAALQS